MLSPLSVCAILNPQAGNGRAGLEQSNIEKILSRYFSKWKISLTTMPKHAIILAKQAAQDGYDIVVAIGGDGSCHEVINGLMQAERKPIFGVIPFGTGGDFRKSLHIPQDIEKAIQILAHGTDKTIDVGLAEVTIDKNGELCLDTRYFINVAGFGANGEVVDKSNRWSKRFGGRITFLNATVHTTFTYHPPKVQLSWRTCATESTPQTWTGEMLSCFIANATYCGGGMQVAPIDCLGDQQLHLRVLPKMSVASQLYNLPKLYNDEIHKLNGTVSTTVTSIEAATTKNTLVQIDLDGELSGRLPAKFSLCPKALIVRGAFASTT